MATWRFRTRGGSSCDADAPPPSPEDERWLDGSELANFFLCCSTDATFNSDAFCGDQPLEYDPPGAPGTLPVSPTGTAPGERKRPAAVEAAATPVADFFLRGVLGGGAAAPRPRLDADALTFRSRLDPDALRLPPRGDEKRETDAPRRRRSGGGRYRSPRRADAATPRRPPPRSESRALRDPPVEPRRRSASNGPTIAAVDALVRRVDAAEARADAAEAKLRAAAGRSPPSPRKRWTPRPVPVAHVGLEEIAAARRSSSDDAAAAAAEPPPPPPPPPPPRVYRRRGTDPARAGRALGASRASHRRRPSDARGRGAAARVPRRRRAAVTAAAAAAEPRLRRRGAAAGGGRGEARGARRPRRQRGVPRRGPRRVPGIYLGVPD